MIIYIVYWSVRYDCIYCLYIYRLLELLIGIIRYDLSLARHISFVGIRMLWRKVRRGYGDHSPLRYASGGVMMMM